MKGFLSFFLVILAVITTETPIDIGTVYCVAAKVSQSRFPALKRLPSVGLKETMKKLPRSSDLATFVSMTTTTTTEPITLPLAYVHGVRKKRLLTVTCECILV